MITTKYIIILSAVTEHLNQNLPKRSYDTKLALRSSAINKLNLKKLFRTNVQYSVFPMLEERSTHTETHTS